MSIRQAPDPDDPVDYFIEHLRSTGKSNATVRDYGYALKHLETYLNQRDLSPEEVTDRECVDFISWLQGRVSQVTAASYANTANQFYQFFSNRGTFETNPMAVALNDMNLSHDSDRHRREISLEEMQEFVGDTTHPQTLTVVVLLAKTGIRRGEAVNLDLADLNIDHPGARRVLPEPRSEIDDRPDSLFISSEISEGSVVRGERRQNGNKRQRDTIVPLDNELKRVLLHWVAVRPPSPKDVEPLFSMQSATGTDRVVGERITHSTLQKLVQKRAESNGWYSKGGGVQSNVTPHYFRHWFGTMAERHGLSRPLIKYIRGDVGDDIIDHYRHFWGDEVRNGYTENIYKLFPS